MEETRNASPYSHAEDRISRLPDGLIHHILSFIDTKYALQTCVLSKRWIDIWKSLPFLNFNRSSFPHDNTKGFIEFVYMVFMFRDEIDIQKFSVDWENSAFDNTVVMNVNRWSVNAVKYHVQEISIVIDQCHNSAYEIPHRLLNCKSLRKLVIEVYDTAGYLDIILPRSMNLPKLKELSFNGLWIPSVELFERLISSCPVLETLSITDSVIQSDNPRKLIVDSVSLKLFAYTCYHLPGNVTMASVIKLCAPNLETFACGFLFRHDCSLEISSPLSGVLFDMKLEENEEDENADTYSELSSGEIKVHAKRMMEHLKAVYMVKGMRLSPGFLEVLSQAPDLLDCQAPRLCNLKTLTLEMWCTRGCLRAVAYLLKISPHVTQLFLTSKGSNFADVGGGWKSGLSFRGMLPHLKYVQIVEAEGCDAELKILCFLLKNAKVLEEVSISLRSSVCSPDRKRQIEEFKDKLRAVPAASSSVEMVFDYSLVGN